MFLDPGRNSGGGFLACGELHTNSRHRRNIDVGPKSDASSSDPEDERSPQRSNKKAQRSNSGGDSLSKFTFNHHDHGTKLLLQQYKFLFGSSKIVQKRDDLQNFPGDKIGRRERCLRRRTKPILALLARVVVVVVVRGGKDRNIMYSRKRRVDLMKRVKKRREDDQNSEYAGQEKRISRKAECFRSNCASNPVIASKKSSKLYKWLLKL